MPPKSKNKTKRSNVQPQNRNTELHSISFDKTAFKEMEEARKRTGQTRSEVVERALLHYMGIDTPASLSPVDENRIAESILKKTSAKKPDV